MLEACEYPRPPDLQIWIAKYGGYWKIPWHLWDEAMAVWQFTRRRYTAGTVIEGRKEDHVQSRR